MLIEFSMVPLGTGEHLSGPLSEVLRLVADSGVRYRLTPGGTCIEGDWDEVMPLIHRCHEALRRESAHVLTDIRIEDDEGTTDMLESNVRTLELRLGRPLENLQSRHVVLEPS